MTPEGERSINRDVLRAELVGLELRLVKSLEEKLSEKASQSQVTEIAEKISAVERGDFTRGHQRGITELIENHTAAKANANWTTKERILAVLLALIAVGSFLVTVRSLLPGAPT